MIEWVKSLFSKKQIVTKKVGRPVGSKNKKRRMSKDARMKLSECMKLRWARMKALEQFVEVK